MGADLDLRLGEAADLVARLQVLVRERTLDIQALNLSSSTVPDDGLISFPQEMHINR